MTQQKLRDVALAISLAIAINAFWLAVLAVSLGLIDFPNGDNVVYTTRTGECYHLSGCSSLRQSKYKTTIRAAVADGYYSCSNCDAPILKGEDGFSFDFVHYLVVVPFSAMCAFASSDALLRKFYIDTPHYLVHLVLAALLSAGFDMLI